MAKLKKLGIWTFGLMLSLAFVLYQLVQLLASYVLNQNIVSVYIQSLNVSQNYLMLGFLSWSLLIITVFLFGIIFVAIYNLVSRWVGVKLEITEKKR